MGDFKLSAQLIGHETDVRAVAFPAPEVVLSASRDRSVRVWNRTNEAPPVFEPHMAVQGTEFVNSLAFLPPTPENPNGLVLSAGKETIIDVRDPTANPSDDPFRLLVGHAHNVCTLDVAPNNKWFVSGGWDGQARVWGVTKWETSLLLDGHQGMSVWAVLALDISTVVTGCADKSIRIFDLKRSIAGEAKPIAEINTPDIVRALCKLPDDHPSGARFASAGNDGVIRLWKMNGQQVAELMGHENFIYSLTTLPTGELISSGEDRTVRIWKEKECVQTITIPAISVWTVAACPTSGDIVAGSSDGVARVFTRDPKRVADAETLKEFDDSIKASSIPQQQVGEINKEKLPGPEFLTSRSGTKEGQVQMIKEEDGSITAHTWSMGQQTWVNVGTVVDAAASTGKKVEYQGKAYDFVFDVAIEEGQPSLKLPHNLSDNPYESATKFINNNELSLNYLDQVANFITANTQGATIGEPEPTGGADPLATESRYRPGQPSSGASPTILPHQEYLTILAAKHEAIFAKIHTVNDTYKGTGRKEISLSPTEEATVMALLEPLKSNTEINDEFALSLVLRCLDKWPYSDRLALVDLLRCLSFSPSMAGYLDSSGASIIDSAFKSTFQDTEGEREPNVNLVMMSLRLVVNLFRSPNGRLVAASSADKVIHTIDQFLGLAPNMEPVERHQHNLLIAISTVGINYAILLIQDGEDSGVTADLAKRLGAILCHICKDQSNSEVVFRALVGLGTLMKADKEVATGVRNTVQHAMSNINQDRVRNVGKEILAMLPGGA